MPCIIHGLYNVTDFSLCASLCSPPFACLEQIICREAGVGMRSSGEEGFSCGLQWWQEAKLCISKKLSSSFVFQVMQIKFFLKTELKNMHVLI